MRRLVFDNYQKCPVSLTVIIMGDKMKSNVVYTQSKSSLHSAITPAIRPHDIQADIENT